MPARMFHVEHSAELCVSQPNLYLEILVPARHDSAVALQVGRPDDAVERLMASSPCASERQEEEDRQNESRSKPRCVEDSGKQRADVRVSGGQHKAAPRLGRDLSAGEEALQEKKNCKRT